MSSFPAEWIRTKLGKVAKEMFGGGTPSTKKPNFWQGNIPWLTSKSLGDSIYLTAGEKTISEEAVRKSATHIVPAGNLIFATRVGVGKVVVTKIDVAISQDGTGIVVDPTEVDPTFLAYQLRTDSVQRFVQQNKRGATIQGITRTALQQVDVAIPPLPEQRRIAHVLTTVQTAIAQQAWLIALTRELKSALMKKLFTEGVTTTRPHGSPRPVRSMVETEIGPVPERWKTTNIGSIAKLQSGGTPSRNNPNYWTGGTIPWVKTGEINYKVIEATEEFITEEGLNNSAAKILPKGTLLAAMYGQGVTRGRVGILGLDATTNQACAAIIPLDKKQVMTWFLYYYMQFHYQDLRDLGHGANQRNLNMDLIKSFPLSFPEIEEQQNIVDTLLAFDKKLLLIEQKRKLLEEFFRTLLHQLMTGQIRTTDITGL